MTSLFDDMKDYVGFTPDDSALLAELAVRVRPHVPAIVDHFYACILRHPRAHAAITGGAAQVERLKGTLREWLESSLVGPHDEAYFERRSRIGRRHVRIDLPQRYMLSAMDVMRTDVRAIVENEYADPELRQRTGNALDKLFDIELAIMLETYKEDSEARLRRKERLATLGQLAATVGHELRNPLGVIESSLFLLRRRVGEDVGVARHLDKIQNQVALTGQIVTDLLELTRDSAPKTAPVRASELVEAALREVRLPDPIIVRREVPVDLFLDVNASLLRRALVNVLGNAARALGARGVIVISGTAAGDQAELAVEDDGPGFDEDILADAFEPLVTRSEGGVGLGLALVRRVLERHGGRATAANRPGGGAVVRLTMPRALAAPETDG
ncbi:MAG: histidine kinase [Deltaproteobacteria bacterium]|nr:histidine kinase [Deltaproteobacteria bacterium]